MVCLKQNFNYWAEYYDAAMWCAKRNILFNDEGKIEKLPQLLSAKVYETIMDDPDTFNDAIQIEMQNLEK